MDWFCYGYILKTSVNLCEPNPAQLTHMDIVWPDKFDFLVTNKKQIPYG